MRTWDDEQAEDQRRVHTTRLYCLYRKTGRQEGNCRLTTALLLPGEETRRETRELVAGWSNRFPNWARSPLEEPPRERGGFPTHTQVVMERQLELEGCRVRAARRRDGDNPEELR